MDVDWKLFNNNYSENYSELQFRTYIQSFGNSIRNKI